MKRNIRLNFASVLLASVCLSWAVVDAQSIDLYTSGNLGNGTGNPKIQRPLSEADWFAHFGPSAILNRATHWTGGFTRGHVALLTHAGNPGNPYRENSVLLWTTNFTAKADIQNLTEISFTQNNNDAENIVPHFAIRVGEQWYVSDKTYEHPGGNQMFYESEFNQIEWSSLSFVPESKLVWNSDDVKSFDELEGTIDGVGLFYEKITERARLRNMRVCVSRDE